MRFSFYSSLTIAALVARDSEAVMLDTEQAMAYQSILPANFLSDLAQICSENQTDASNVGGAPGSFCDIIENRKKTEPERKNPSAKVPIPNKHPIVAPPHPVKKGALHKGKDMYHVEDEDLSSSGWSASESDDKKKPTLFDKKKTDRPVPKAIKQAENGSDSEDAWEKTKQNLKQGQEEGFRGRQKTDEQKKEYKNGDPEGEFFRKVDQCPDCPDTKCGDKNAKKIFDAQPWPSDRSQAQTHSGHGHKSKPSIAVSTAQTDVTACTEAEAKVETETKTEAKAEAETKTETEAKVETETKVETEAKTEVQSEAQAGVKSDTTALIKAKAESKGLGMMNFLNMVKSVLGMTQTDSAPAAATDLAQTKK